LCLTTRSFGIQYKVIVLFIVHVSYDSTSNCELFLRVGLFEQWADY